MAVYFLKKISIILLTCMSLISCASKSYVTQELGDAVLYDNKRPNCIPDWQCYTRLLDGDEAWIELRHIDQGTATLRAYAFNKPELSLNPSSFVFTVKDSRGEKLDVTMAEPFLYSDQGFFLQFFVESNSSFDTQLVETINFDIEYSDHTEHIQYEFPVVLKRTGSNPILNMLLGLAFPGL